MRIIGALLEQEADHVRTPMPTELVLRLELSGKLFVSRWKVKADRQDCCLTVNESQKTRLLRISN